MPERRAARADRAARLDSALLAALAAVNFWLVLRTFTAAMTGVPNTGDEFAVLFQAKIFASGRWTAPAPSEPIPFMTDYLAVRDGRWFGVYPPLYPLLLAGGLLLGDARQVPAALSSLSLVLLFLFVHRAYADRALAWASTLLLFCAPSFRLYSASYYTHAASLAAVLAALAFFPGPGSVLAAAAGAAARPFETGWASLALLPGWAAQARRRPAVRAALLAGAALALLGLAANFRAYLNVVNGGGKLAFLIEDVSGTLGRLWTMLADAARWLFAWGVFRSGNLKDAGPGDVNAGLALALAALVFAAYRARRDPDGPARRADRLLLALLGWELLGHLFYRKTGGRFGERRLYEAEFALCVLAARLLLAAEAAGPRALRGRLRWVLFPSLVAGGALVYLPRTVARLRAENERRFLPYALAEREGLTDALIFVRDAPEFYPAFYARNDPDLRGNVWAPSGWRESLAAAAAGPRPQRELRRDKKTGAWTLAPRLPPVEPATDAQRAAARITPAPRLILMKGGEPVGYGVDGSTGQILGSRWLTGRAL